MANLFSENLIRDVLDKSDIVEVVSSYIPLKKNGRSFKTTCPFHHEKTPSFIVSQDKQIFHCFGCGVGGDALKFIMQYEKLNFREAMEALAQRSGVVLPQPERADFQRSAEDITKSIYSLYEQASAFYQHNLLSLKEAAGARDYLEGRGISKESARRFKLGYACAGWDTLLAHLRRGGISLSLIEKSGLAVTKETGGYYDRFRNRIIFPIIDVRERVIGFGARVMDGSLPKYINSPETPIYSKGKNLFGLSLARDHIRSADKIIVVEGYLDMILPYEAGVKNIAASLGTALTIDQIKLIKRWTQNVVMLYDADAAGELAALRALELLIQEDMQVKIASLPQGEDPDSFVRAKGKDLFLKIIAEARPIFDYKLDYLLSKYDIKTPAGKDRVVREILPTIKKFTSNTLRAEYLKRAAEALDADEQALFDDYKNAGRQDSGPAAPVDAADCFSLRLADIPITERMLLKLMLEETHLVGRLRELISPEDFQEEKLRKIVRFIFDYSKPGRECRPNMLMRYLENEELACIVSELSALEIHQCPNREKFISDCVQRLKRDKFSYQCRQLHRRIQSAQTEGDQEAVGRLVLEYNTLLKQRSLIYGETGH